MSKLFLPFKKATLLIPSGPVQDPDRNHLFIILTNPSSENSKRSLLVSVSSYTGNHCDKACVLNKEDHKFIRHKSFVDYYRARIIETDKLINGVRKGLFKLKEPVNDEVFDKIIRGLLNSRRATPKTKNFYEEFS